MSDEPAQGSTVDYCERWPEEGHSWTWTKHAGLPTVSTRTCFGCRYLDVTEVQDALRRYALDLNDVLARVASLTAERDRLRAELDEEDWTLRKVRKRAYDLEVERDAALASLAAERVRAAAWQESALHHARNLAAERGQTARMRAVVEAAQAYVRQGGGVGDNRATALRLVAAVDALDAGAATGGEDE